MKRRPLVIGAGLLASMLGGAMLWGSVDVFALHSEEHGRFLPIPGSARMLAFDVAVVPGSPNKRDNPRCLGSELVFAVGGDHQNDPVHRAKLDTDCRPESVRRASSRLEMFSAIEGSDICADGRGEVFYGSLAGSNPMLGTGSLHLAAVDDFSHPSTGSIARRGPDRWDTALLEHGFSILNLVVADFDLDGTADVIMGTANLVNTTEHHELALAEKKKKSEDRRASSVNFLGFDSSIKVSAPTSGEKGIRESDNPCTTLATRVKNGCARYLKGWVQLRPGASRRERSTASCRWSLAATGQQAIKSSGARTIRLTDLNADGYPDLVMAGQSVSVALGGPEGTFQPPQHLSPITALNDARHFWYGIDVVQTGTSTSGPLLIAAVRGCYNEAECKSLIEDSRKGRGGQMGIDIWDIESPRREGIDSEHQFIPLPGVPGDLRIGPFDETPGLDLVVGTLAGSELNRNALGGPLRIISDITRSKRREITRITPSPPPLLSRMEPLPLRPRSEDLIERHHQSVESTTPHEVQRRLSVYRGHSMALSASFFEEACDSTDGAIPLSGTMHRAGERFASGSSKAKCVVWEEAIGTPWVLLDGAEGETTSYIWYPATIPESEVPSTGAKKKGR